MDEMSFKPKIYHEKQVKELCALHALNNLFQNKTYSKVELDEICSRLSPNVWINPHRSLLGLGNYDINVIMAALQKKGFEALWFDKRKDPSRLNVNHIYGFIMNVPTDYRLGFVMLPLRRRHWVAIRPVANQYYNLDSKLDAPHLIGQSDELIAYLKDQLECKEKELFVIVSKEIEQKQLWLAPAQPKDSVPANERSESPSVSVNSYPEYNDYRNRDMHSLNLNEVHNRISNHIDDI